MDAPGTLFYLVPTNNRAAEVVLDPANGNRKCLLSHKGKGVPCLRIGLDQPVKTPSRLLTFGRRSHNDVILGPCFSRYDQCYFDFNKETGELLLHDTSVKMDTQLYHDFLDEGTRMLQRVGQIRKSPRQCVVLLIPDPNRELILEISEAEFQLILPTSQGQDGERLTKQKLAFAHQPDPERTLDGTQEQPITLGLQPLRCKTITTIQTASTVAYNPHNSRFITLLEPDAGDVIRFTRLSPLGSGGQGDVYKVVDMYNGNHHACKIIAVKAKAPELNIYSEKEFRAKAEKEVNLVRQLKHDHIVPYTHFQEFKSQSIQIFMPIYDGSLHDLIRQFRSEGPQVVRDMANRMLSQILDALDYVHSHDPPIIHRDIKPANILYQGSRCDRFFLTDFGIAKVVDTSKTQIGTQWYAAPDVMRNAEQTPKIDIYSLGVTVVECLVELGDVGKRPLWREIWRDWQRDLWAHMNQHAPQYASMLADDPCERPTARELLNQFFPKPTHAPLRNPQTNPARTSLGVLSPANEANGATVIYPTAMDWTKIVATGIAQGVSQPMQQDESMQSPQPNPGLVQSPKAPPNRPLQPRAGRGGSVKSSKSAKERQRENYKRSRSSQSGQPRPAGVPKRTHQVERGEHLLEAYARHRGYFH